MSSCSVRLEMTAPMDGWFRKGVRTSSGSNSSPSKSAGSDMTHPFRRSSTETQPNYFELMTQVSLSRIDSVAAGGCHGAQMTFIPASELHLSMTTSSGGGWVVEAGSAV
jgi:hypothetical protein